MLVLKRVTGQMLVPSVLIVVSALLVWKWPVLIQQIGNAGKIKAFLDILPLLPFAILPLCAFMGIRYNNTGLILTSIVLICSYLALFLYPYGKGGPLLQLISFLIPVNIMGFSIITKKRLASITGLLCLLLILLQIVFLCISLSPINKDINDLLIEFCKHLSIKHENIVAGSYKLTAFLLNNDASFSIPVIVSFSLSMIFFAARFIIHRDILTIGYFGTLVAVFLGVSSQNHTPGVPVYFISAALILVFTNIEASFFRAYVDELTGLPGRRSLNETMANLGRKYSIAMLDIDHFKKFNDTYGHKTGDDVLKMVASKFAEISGGAKTFRYGGEEFTAVFRGKSIDEVMPHLENFRYIIENSSFTVRSKARKKGNQQDRGKDCTKKQINVTISIGVAGPGKNQNTPEKVMKAADKSLYKAKKAGRNCVRC